MAFMVRASGLHRFENSSIALRDLIERNLEHLAALAGGANAHANLSTILTTLLLAAPAMPYPGAAEDGGPPKYGKNLLLGIDFAITVCSSRAEIGWTMGDYGKPQTPNDMEKSIHTGTGRQLIHNSMGDIADNEL